MLDSSEGSGCAEQGWLGVGGDLGFRSADHGQIDGGVVSSTSELLRPVGVGGVGIDFAGDDPPLPHRIRRRFAVEADVHWAHCVIDLGGEECGRLAWEQLVEDELHRVGGFDDDDLVFADGQRLRGDRLFARAP